MSVTPTDGELLRAADHDPHAFRVLYDRWAQPLLAFCYRRTGDPEASLDLVAETFAIAYQKRHRYRDRGRPVGAWLYGIAARERWTGLLTRPSKAATSPVLPQESWLLVQRRGRLGSRHQ